MPITNLRPAFRVFASDDDLGINAALEYNIVEGNTEGLFKINKETGEIYTDGQLKADETYEFTVRKKFEIDVGQC